MGFPGPRERPGRDPEAEAERLTSRFRGVSRRIESRTGRGGGSRRTAAHGRARSSPVLGIVLVVVLAIAVAMLA